MPITEQQRIERRASIGSSDVAAILGVDTFRNAADVYWSKVQVLDTPGNPAMDAGTRFEPTIMDWLAERQQVRLLIGKQSSTMTSYREMAAAAIANLETAAASTSRWWSQSWRRRAGWISAPASATPSTGAPRARGPASGRGSRARPG